MEKNVIVKDEFGKQVGFTYPKRARGLVKNGRAEYVGDCEIRMRKITLMLMLRSVILIRR